ncbi:MAG: hypothetical protein CM15mP68_7440 [Pseudomonadota bacterium]|nr:MAG: hypothetical protein CM15mP68_7440 [Pseudomonadota bacterium]
MVSAVRLQIVESLDRFLRQIESKSSTTGYPLFKPTPQVVQQLQLCRLVVIEVLRLKQNPMSGYAEWYRCLSTEHQAVLHRNFARQRHLHGWHQRIAKSTGRHRCGQVFERFFVSSKRSGTLSLPINR